MGTARCRVCLSESDRTRNIFAEGCSNGQSYAEALMNCVKGVTVSESDNLPTGVCDACVNQLESWIVCDKIDDCFVSKCTYSNDVLTGTSIKTEPESYEFVSVPAFETKPIAEIKSEPVEYTHDDQGNAPIDRPRTCRRPKKSFAKRKLRNEISEERSVCDVTFDGQRRGEKKTSTAHPPSVRLEKLYDERFAIEGVSATRVDGKSFECDCCGNAPAGCEEARPAISGSFSCDGCEKSFGAQIARTSPLSREKPYACVVCEKRFVRKNGLDSHLRTQHDAPPPPGRFECDRCEKKFATRRESKVHSRVHTGDYKCDRCDRVFYQRHALTVHVRTHTGERPYACDRCEKRFTRKDHLAIHVRMHTGEKKFVCDRCGKTFTQSNHLKSHYGHVHARKATARRSRWDGHVADTPKEKYAKRRERRRLERANRHRER